MYSSRLTNQPRRTLSAASQHRPRPGVQSNYLPRFSSPPSFDRQNQHQYQIQPQQSLMTTTPLSSKFAEFKAALPLIPIQCQGNFIQGTIRKTVSPPMNYTTMFESISTVLNMDTYHVSKLLSEYIINKNLRNNALSSMVTRKSNCNYTFLMLVAATFGLNVTIHSIDHSNCNAIKPDMAIGTIHIGIKQEGTTIENHEYMPLNPIIEQKITTEPKASTSEEVGQPIEPTANMCTETLITESTTNVELKPNDEILIDNTVIIEEKDDIIDSATETMFNQPERRQQSQEILDTEHIRYAPEVKAAIERAKSLAPSTQIDPSPISNNNNNINPNNNQTIYIPDIPSALPSPYLQSAQLVPTRVTYPSIPLKYNSSDQSHWMTVLSILTTYSNALPNLGGWTKVSNTFQLGAHFPTSLDILTSSGSTDSCNFDVWSQMLSACACLTTNCIHINFPMIDPEFQTFQVSAPHRFAISLLTGFNVVVYNAITRSAVLTSTSITHKTIFIYETSADNVNFTKFIIQPNLTMVHAMFPDEGLLVATPSQILLAKHRTVFYEKHFKYDQLKSTVTQYSFKPLVDLIWLTNLKTTFENYVWKVIDDRVINKVSSPKSMMKNSKFSQDVYYASMTSKIQARRRTYPPDASVMYINGQQVSDQINYIAIPEFKYQSITKVATSPLTSSYYDYINYWIIKHDDIVLLLTEFVDQNTKAVNSSLRLYFQVIDDDIILAFASGFSGMTIEVLEELGMEVITTFASQIQIPLIEHLLQLNPQEYSVMTLQPLSLPQYKELFYITSVRDTAAVLYRYRDNVSTRTSHFDYLSYKINCGQHELIEFIKSDHTIKLPCGILIDEKAVHMHTHQCVLRQRAYKTTSAGDIILSNLLDITHRCKYCKVYYPLMDDAKYCHK